MAREEHLFDHQVLAMIEPITEILEVLQPLGVEQRTRIISGVACFFNCEREVVERIERAGREAKRGS